MSSTIVSVEKLEALKSKIKEAFPEGVTDTDIVYCVVACMTMVGQIEISGQQKKDLVMDLVIHCMTVNDVGPSDSSESTLKLIIPHMIDRLISVEQGKLRFNSQRLKSFFGNIISCMSCKKY